MSQLAAVEFAGEDAAAFLQGQLTVNTLTLAPGHWRRAAFCSRQGRVIACGILGRLPTEAQRLVFIVAADIAADFKTQIARYILRAKVRAEVLPARFVAMLPAAVAPPPSGGIVTITDSIAAFTEEAADGVNLFFNLAEAADDSMLTGGAAVTADDGFSWVRAEIQRAVPWISAQASARLIPQFINLEILDGVDFDKGCYVGQEIIARLHYLGEVKRRGVILRGNTPPPPVASAVTTEAGKSAGEIINAAPADNGYIALAAVMPALMEETLIVAEHSVTVSPPPYVLPVKETA